MHLEARCWPSGFVSLKAEVSMLLHVLGWVAVRTVVVLRLVTTLGVFIQKRFFLPLRTPEWPQEPKECSQNVVCLCQSLNAQLVGFYLGTVAGPG